MVLAISTDAPCKTAGESERLAHSLHLLEQLRMRVPAVPSDSVEPHAFANALRSAGFENILFLDRGDIAFCFRATHRDLSRTLCPAAPSLEPFVVRVLQPGAATLEIMAAFETARLMYPHLRHENLPAYVDDGVLTLQGVTGAAVHLPYLAMEFISGSTLRSYDGHLDPEDRLIAVRGLLDAARAAGYLHSRGINHGDIKPENIRLDYARKKGVLLDPDFLRVTDPGLASSIPAAPIRLGETYRGLLSWNGLTTGSKGFIAPEAGVSEGPQADVFSLGVTLCKLCGFHFSSSGEAVSPGQSSPSISPDDVFSDFDALTLRYDGASSSMNLFKVFQNLAALAHRATSPDADERPANGYAFARLLREAISCCPWHSPLSWSPLVYET